MKKLFFVFCYMSVFILPCFAQDYKIVEPYGASATSGKLSSKSTQKYTYLYDTSLIQAIKLKDEHRVKMLMYAQVNPNEKNDEGFTPLYFAAQYLTPETLTMLLDRGAKVNLPSTYNLTPLMAAAAAGRADNVKILLEYGADPNMLDDKDLTALDHAFNNHQLEAAILLNPITTIKKPTMNYDELLDESMNGKAALEHMQTETLAEPPLAQDNNLAPEPELVIPVAVQEEPMPYNPTLAEIDLKIEQTRQALNRLITLREQILAQEQQQLMQKEANTTELEEANNNSKTYTKTTSTKTSVKKTSSTTKFGAKTANK